MMDARFEDGAPRSDVPLALMAQDSDDLPAISALLQDAVFTGADIGYVPARRRLALLITRLRWEDRSTAEASGRPYERVRALLVVENITALRRAGFDPSDKAAVHAALSLQYAAHDALGGTLTLILSGGGAIAMEVETIDITLHDVARPHLAQAQTLPDHTD